MRLTKKKRWPPKNAAVLTILRAGDMTPKGRREIAQWLQDQAASLIYEGRKYAARYVGRWQYRESV